MERLRLYFESNSNKIIKMIENYEKEGISINDMAFLVSFYGGGIQVHLFDLKSISAYYYIHNLNPKMLSFMGIPIYFTKGEKYE